MKRAFPLTLSLLLCGALALLLGGATQFPADPLLGQWVGRLHYENESKLIGVRFEIYKNSTAMFYDIPEMKIHHLGPLPVEKNGDEYKTSFSGGTYVFTWHFAPDMQGLSGAFRFDGHELLFELKRGALPAQEAPPEPQGRVAQPAWTFKTGRAIWSSPSVADHLVYFGSDDGFVYALKANSGQQVWQSKTGGPVLGKPVVYGSFVYVLSDDGYLYKLARQDGQVVWKFDTHGGIPRDPDAYDTQTSAPALMNGTVCIGSADKKLYAVDAENGSEKWHFETQGIVRSTPAVADGRVFFGSRDHNVYAVDAKTGALNWKYDTRREVVSEPLVASGTVYVGSRCSDLFAFDAATGKIKWKYFYWSSWVESSARMRDGILYIGSSDGQQLFAIYAATGKTVWNFDTNGSPWSTPAVTEKRVYIGAVGVLHYIIDHHGGFFAVDRATGREVWRFPMKPMAGSDVYGVASSPAVDQGFVFFSALDGTFYAFRTDD